MKENVRFIFYGCLAMLTACASRSGMQAVRQDLNDLQRQVEATKAEQRAIDKEIVKLRAQTQQYTANVRETHEDIRARLSQAAEQIRSMNDRLQVKLGKKLPGSLRLYDSAYRDFQQGYYDRAREGFMQYMRLKPDGDLLDYAQYWIGESYYAQKKYDKALQSFSAVIERFPDSDKVRLALWQKANCEIALGETNAAKESLRAIITRFPNSEQAHLAQAKLKGLR